MANVVKGLTGAASGAGAGAALGPWGAAIGGGVGLLAGLFGGGDDNPPVAQHAPITDPVTGQQVQDAYSGTQTGLSQSQDFVNALRAQNGIANQSSVFNQLQGVANGTGPNPAQAMLAQQTGNNVANQAALMAGQRGAGANAGLIARQAAMQGGALQQQAAGQGATLQAQQSLGALNQLGGIAGQQVGQQANAINAHNQFAQNNYGNILNAAGQFNNAQVGATGSVNSFNSPLAQGNQAFNNNLTGGLLNGAGTVATAIGGAKGAPAANTSNATNYTNGTNSGMSNVATPQDWANVTGAPGAAVMKAEGGLISPQPPGNGPRSAVGRHLKGVTANPPMMASGGPVMMSAKSGGQVPGKAKVAGNSYANDNVKALLSPGEVVLPRSVTQSADPVSAAAQFVHAIMAKKGKLA